MKDLFPWLEDTELKEALNTVVDGAILDQAQARTLLAQLHVSSQKLIKTAVSEPFYTAYFPTNRHGAPWAAGQPTGLVDHYTSAPWAAGSLRWFSSQERKDKQGNLIKGNSSAHIVMDRNGACLIVVDPLTTIAWHATWANPTHIGIEHVNCGLLRKVGNAFYFMDNLAYPTARVPQIQEIIGKFWEPFTVLQFVSNIVLKRLFRWAMPTLVQDKFVEHKDIDPVGKIDCGPLWASKELNMLAFSDKAFRDMQWVSREVLLLADVEAFRKEVAGY